MLSLNIQPVEKRVEGLGETLDVVNTWGTIQGEGPFAGMPAVFCRLAGCNLQCEKCDTNYTYPRQRKEIGEIVQEIQAIRRFGLVVVTGGEPFRQPIGLLLRTLVAEGYLVQIETNGTLYQTHLPWNAISIVCSPKTTKIHANIESKVTAYKYILAEGLVDTRDGLPLSSLGETGLPFRPACLGHPRFPFPPSKIFVQPLDEGDSDRNQLNLQAAIQSCLKYGYRLSYQLHKLLGLE